MFRRGHCCPLPAAVWLSVDDAAIGQEHLLIARVATPGAIGGLLAVHTAATADLWSVATAVAKGVAAISSRQPHMANE